MRRFCPCLLDKLSTTAVVLLATLIGAAQARAAVCVENPSWPGSFYCVFNNGLAPPNPANVIGDLTHQADNVITRNSGCPPAWPDGDYGDPCPAPGIPTEVALADGGHVAVAEVYDSSRLTVSGGWADILESHDSSTIQVSGESGSQPQMDSYDSSTIRISAGTANTVWAHDSSTILFSGGSTWPFYAYDSSTVAISGGIVSGFLGTIGTSDATVFGGFLAHAVVSGSSTLTMSAGMVGSHLVSQQSGTVTMTGGTVSQWLSADDTSAVTISGGTVGEVIAAYDASTITIVGTDFQVDGVPAPEGDLAVVPTGVLTGTLASGEPINNVFQHGDGTITLDILEDCTDAVDNDGDGLVDEDDPECEIDYVALGDSFSSGEGVGFDSYLPGTYNNDNNTCHRSYLSYGFKLRSPSYLRSNLNLPSEHFLACSGALADNVGIGGPAAAKDSSDNSQLDMELDGGPLKVVNPSTDLITITIGGNDLEFSTIVASCWAGSHCNTNGAFVIDDDGRSIYDIANEHLPTLTGEVTELLSQIRARAPLAAIFLLGYPKLFNSSASPIKCHGFDFNERIAARDVTQQLNERLEAAASNAGVHFVDVNDTYKTFSGYELCTSTPFFNSRLGELHPETRYDKEEQAESFHPNALGQNAYREALEEHIERLHDGGCRLNPAGLPWEPCLAEEAALSSGFPAKATAPSDGPAKKYGSLDVEAVSPIGCDTHGKFVPGESIRIVGEGFAGATTVEIRMSNAEETYTAIIGTTTSDSGGGIDYSFAIPSDFPPNEECGIGAIGLMPNGAQLALFSINGVVDSNTLDSDLDTIPDVCDICPREFDPVGDPENQPDADGDGVGDACDECMFDAQDDVDNDGFCADVDPCELDPENDLDGDGFCADADGDDDGDGLLDYVETGTGVFVSDTDTGTDRLVADTDGDGFDDGTEVAAGTNPNNPYQFPSFPIPLLGSRGLVLLLVLLGGAAALVLRRRGPRVV